MAEATYKGAQCNRKWTACACAWLHLCSFIVQFRVDCNYHKGIYKIQSQIQEFRSIRLLPSCCPVVYLTLRNRKVTCLHNLKNRNEHERILGITEFMRLWHKKQKQSFSIYRHCFKHANTWENHPRVPGGKQDSHASVSLVFMCVFHLLDYLGEK